jgi:hypothetical protein
MRKAAEAAVPAAPADASSGPAKVLRFAAVMKIRGINPYIPVSPARAKALRPDWRKPMPVRVRINGKPEKPWRINMMPMGNGGGYLYLHEIVRKESGAGVGDKVDVEMAMHVLSGNAGRFMARDWKDGK